MLDTYCKTKTCNEHRRLTDNFNDQIHNEMDSLENTNGNVQKRKQKILLWKAQKRKMNERKKYE